MMVVGLGYRLLPMMIPATSPSGGSIYISATLLEAGIVGLFTSLVMRWAWTLAFAILILAGFAAFGAHVVWMLARPKRLAQGRSQSDFAVAHVAAAASWLTAACVCGLLLSALPVSDATMRAALLYGVFGLVGFLAQIIVGFERRILPTAAAYWALQRNGGVASEAAQAPTRLRHLIVYCAWLAGVPALGAGFFFNAPPVLALGGWLLLVGVLISAIDAARIIGLGKAA
jgi:hypothetical protein